MKCKVCDDNEAKYKCPKCRLPFKKHKEEACSAVVGVDLDPEEKAEAVERDESEAPLTGLSDVQLKDLEQSAAVRQAVGDPRMKEALRRIDGAKDRRKVLEEIMMDAEFASFADLLLTVIQYEEE